MTIEILTGLLVILTAIYAFLTHRIARANENAVAAMKSQVTAATRPYVHFDIRLDLVFVEAVLTNRGVTAALDLELKCEPQLLRFTQNTQQPAVLPRDRIPLLIPGREIVEFLGSWEEVKAGGQAVPIRVEISYRDGSGTRFEESYSIDVSRFVGMHHIGKGNVADSLRRIADTLEKR